MLGLDQVIFYFYFTGGEWVRGAREIFLQGRQGVDVLAGGGVLGDDGRARRAGGWLGMWIGGAVVAGVAGGGGLLVEDGEVAAVFVGLEVGWQGVGEAEAGMAGGLGKFFGADDVEVGGGGEERAAAGRLSPTNEGMTNPAGGSWSLVAGLFWWFGPGGAYWVRDWVTGGGERGAEEQS